MTQARQQLGKTGEDLACAELQRRGYAILARRYRSPLGEIDIICRERGAIVFVEVKARRGQVFGDGADAITPAKQRRLAAVALEFLARRGLTECACRFDVVAIRLDAAEPQITVFRHAFDAA